MNIPQWLYIYLFEFVETGNISNIVYEKMFLRTDVGNLLLYDRAQPEYSKWMKEVLVGYSKIFTNEQRKAW